MQTFTFWNKFFLLITVICIVWVLYRLQTDGNNFQPESFLSLTLGIPFVLMTFQYESLRKNEVFIAWMVIALLMLAMFFWLRHDSRVIQSNGINAALGLKCPFMFLTAYFIFKKIALKYYSTELLLPSKGSNYNTKEGRYYNAVEYVSLLIYIAIMVLAALF